MSFHDSLRVQFLRDQCEAAFRDVVAYYSNKANELRRRIAAGELSREGAIAELMSDHRLTNVGAADILDNY